MGRESTALQRYLRRHLEAGLPAPPRRTPGWRNVLVIPVYREAPELLARLGGWSGQAGDTLVLLVLNRPASDPDSGANAPLRDALTGLPADGCMDSLYRLDEHSWLYVHDMEALQGATSAARGVGLARKTGCDIALSWMAVGAIHGDWLFSSDADAELPADYFTRLDDCDPRTVAAVFPFRHVPGPDPVCNAATALYELRLHHYVLGLEYAASPYAHHTIGSCLAITASAYAQVGGFPRRSGAEDFYLLNKVSKLGPLAKPGGAPIRLQSRFSSRVPFGTGPAVADIAAREDGRQLPLFYHPACFRALRAILSALPRLRHASVEQLPHLLEASGLEPGLAAAGAGALADMGLAGALDHCRRHGRSGDQFSRQFHQWFDGFRTLKFIHALCDAGWPRVSLERLAELEPRLWPDGACAADDIEGLRDAAARHWGWDH